METQIEDFLTALGDFAEAASTLAEEWERAGDAVAGAEEGYPFPGSFDEVAYAIRLWQEKVRKNLLPRLAEPSR